MKILALFLLVYTSFAMPSEEEKKDKEFYGTTIREKEVEAKLLDSSLYKDCVEQSKNETDSEEKVKKTNKCLQDKITENPNDEEIKNLAKKLDLGKIKGAETKTAEGIKEYLSERIEKAIYGDKFDPKDFAKKKKYVDQGLFLDLYKEQLGKNLLLDVSNYCLENLRYTTSPPSSSPNPSYNPLETPSTCIKNPKNPDCLKDLVEINFPIKIANGDSDKNKIENIGGTVEKLQDYSQKELEKKSNDPNDPKYFEEKSVFCMNVVNVMCDRYKCLKDSTIDSNCNDLTASNGSITNANPKIFNLTETSKNSGKYTTGSIACTVINKMREYKKTITQIDEVKEKLKETQSKNGFSDEIMDSAFSGIYQNGQGSNEESITEIATISSHEISQNKDIKDLYGLEDKAKKLEECKTNANSDECKKLVDTDIDEKLVSLETSFKAETLVREKEIKDLFKENNKDKIKDYLKKLGLEQYYKDDESMDETKLKDLITSHYKSERESLITEMKKKFDKLKVKKSGSEDIQIQDAVENTISELETKKDRLETILHYNNIITSFLTLSDANDKDKTYRNSLALEKEKEGYDKFKGTDDDTAEEYFKNFESNSDSSDKASNIGYMNYIDSVLGNPPPKK